MSDQNNNYSDEKWNSLFKNVFNNVVLSRLIFNYSRLLSKNKVVEFKNLNSLKEYQEIEFIEKLIYKGDELIGNDDLPRNSFLKEIVLHNSKLFGTPGDVIPNGVEVLQYFSYKTSTMNTTNSTTFSKLPTSIHTLKNVMISNVEDGIGQEGYDENAFKISSNIKSISFIQCPNISGEKGSIIIPNTVQELIFPYMFNNDGFPLRENDLPTSLTSLTYFNFCGDINKRITVEEFVENLKLLLLPLINLQALKIRLCVERLSPNTLSKYCSPSLKQLTLSYLSRTIIEPHSIPSSVTDLSLGSIYFKLEKDIIPYGIKTLSLSFYDDSVDLEEGDDQLFEKNRNRFEPGCLPDTIETLTLGTFSEFDSPINQHGIFPSSLTHLIFTNELYTDYMITMISFIPTSVHTITIKENNETLKQFQFPSHVKTINYVY